MGWNVAVLKLRSGGVLDGMSELDLSEGLLPFQCSPPLLPNRFCSQIPSSSNSLSFSPALFPCSLALPIENMPGGAMLWHCRSIRLSAGGFAGLVFCNWAGPQLGVPAIKVSTVEERKEEGY